MGILDPAPTERCRCGHQATAHQHYRPGTDCALCPAGDCHRFRSALTVPGRLVARLRRR